MSIRPEFGTAVYPTALPRSLIRQTMLNFKSFRSAGSILASIKLIHMNRKGQHGIDGTEAMSFADQFSMLAGMARSA
jgi:putative transposase